MLLHIRAIPLLLLLSITSRYTDSAAVRRDSLAEAKLLLGTFDPLQVKLLPRKARGTLHAGSLSHADRKSIARAFAEQPASSDSFKSNESEDDEFVLFAKTFPDEVNNDVDDAFGSRPTKHRSEGKKGFRSQQEMLDHPESNEDGRVRDKTDRTPELEPEPGEGRTHLQTKKGLTNPENTTTIETPPAVPASTVYLNATRDPARKNEGILVIVGPHDPEESNSAPQVELNPIGASPEEHVLSASAESLIPDPHDNEAASEGNAAGGRLVKGPEPQASNGPDPGPVEISSTSLEEERLTTEPTTPEQADDDVVELGLLNAGLPKDFSSVESPESDPQREEPGEQVNLSAAATVTPLANGNELLQDFTEQAEPSPSQEAVPESVVVEFPLSVSSSSSGVLSNKFDKATRDYFAITTNTTAQHWKPVAVSEMTNSSIQRKQTANWAITYQGELPISEAKRKGLALQRDIDSGTLDTYLAPRLARRDVRVRTVSALKVNVPERDKVTIDDVQETKAAAGNLENSSAESLSGNPKTVPDESDGTKSLGIILGTCFGVIGALVAAVALLVYVRRRRNDDSQHKLDGVVTAPSTVTSIETVDTESSRYQTGAPTKPRGPQVLRNQSRILDWQMDHAEATGNARHILGRGNGRNPPPLE